MTKLIFLLLLAIAAIAQPMHNVTLTWTDPMNPGVETYNVYRMTGTCPTVPPVTTAGFTLVNAAPISALTFVDTGVTFGTTYCYVVTTVVAMVESPPSVPAQATIPPFSPASLTIHAR